MGRNVRTLVFAAVEILKVQPPLALTDLDAGDSAHRIIHHMNYSQCELIAACDDAARALAKRLGRGMYSEGF